MDPSRFTQKTQEAFLAAQAEAVRRGNVETDVEHLLWALLDQEDGLVPRLLNKADVPLDDVRDAVEADLERRPSQSGSGVEPGKVYVTQRLSKLMVKAGDEAK